MRRADGGNARSEAASVFVDAEESDAVQLRQLGNEDQKERHGVPEKVPRIVLGVHAGQQKPATTNTTNKRQQSGLV